MEPAGPNGQQIEYWNQQAGAKWVARQAQLDRQIGELGILAFERAGAEAGARILDVGCGCGGSTLELAHRVGPGGEVLGVDISATMLERAKERARDAGIANARFLLADAQTYRFEPASMDLVYSRFGVMFFAQPTAAFHNLLQALVPGQRLGFVCWQEVARNPWMTIPLAAASKHVELPPPPAPGAPGPFAFADAHRVRRILEDAGFEDVAFDSIEEPITVGGEPELDGAVGFLLEIGPAAAALRDADAEQRSAVQEAVRDALAPFATPEGVRMGSAAWVVTARRPSRTEASR